LPELPVKIAFGPFVFDRAHQILARQGREVPLPPRVLGVLDVLTARPGEIVAKQQLIETVWKDAFVSDTSLTEAISFLRQTLGDDPQQPTYIQTVHRRGYRFLPPPAPTLVPGAEAAVLPPPRDAWPIVLPWAVAVLLAAVAASALWRLSHPDAPPAAPLARFDVAAPAGTTFDGSTASIAISADGTRVAFVACAASDGCRLFSRRLDETEAHAIAGTDGAAAPFLSPDGSAVGFFADGKLKRVDVAGGPPVSLADVRQPLGAVWSDDGTVVFAASKSGGLGGLMRVGASGGSAPGPLYDIDARRGELALAWPDVLPGSRVVLATSIGAPDQPPLASIVAISPLTGERTPIIDRAAAARFVAPNTLVFVRDGQLAAAAFDPIRLRVVGQPTVIGPPVADDVPHFAVSHVGSLALAPSSDSSLPAIAFCARDGRLSPLPAALQHLTSASLSLDGRRLAALARKDPRSDIWTLDIDRGALTRSTFEGEHRAPVWSGGRGLVFAARAGGPFNLFAQRFDAAGAQRLTTADRQQFPSAMAFDDRAVVYTEFDSASGADLWSVPAEGGMPTPLLKTPFDETAASVSPDGRWIAYQSNASNRWEVYARPLPGRGAPTPISTAGGTMPVWSRDGRTIYFSGASGLMAVDVGRDGCVEGEAVCELMPSRPVEVLHGSWIARGTTSDGRVLVEHQRGHELADHLVVTLQWTRELQRLLPPPVVSSPK
jgi:DNA-binding winged helix-turn-helix (wHTH) protein/Tol biopolymer transport system component